MIVLPIGQCLETFFCVHPEGEGILLASSEQRLGILLDILQCTGRLPTINNYLSQKDNGGEVNLGLS